MSETPHRDEEGGNRPALRARIWSRLTRASPRALILLSGALIALVALLDYLTGEQLSVSVFYTGPIFLLTWFVSRRAGLAGSALCAAARLALALGADTGLPKSVAVWNTGGELGFFLLGTFTFAALKEELSRERTLSRTDMLTGVASRRAFLDRLELELARARRDGSTMTLAFVDLDDFKDVNDRLGHAAGDAALRRIAQRLQERLRPTDLVARMGGDEFALLLPGANAAAARGVLDRLTETGSDGVTLSIGALAFGPPHDDVDELLRRADALMYRAKNSGKNSVFVEEWALPVEPAAGTGR